MDADTGDTQEDKIVFTDDQQEHVSKLLGRTRIEAREKATKDAKAAQAKATEEAERVRMAAEEEWKKLAAHHEARVAELEPYEVEAKAYRGIVAGMLKNRVKALGDAAKKAVGALPESLSDLEKLNWLNENQALFEAGGTSRVGTPAKGKKRQPIDKSRDGHRRMRL